jgi:competence ComEA-like helix-hairpin-helix protein
MTRNICGNDPSHLRCEIDDRRRNPTLRIGLISVAPSEHSTAAKLVLIVILALMIVASSCSSRVEYERSAAASRVDDAVNINTATADELEKLPGIGRKTAESIVSYRSENGPFRRVENVMLIRGMSERRFIELKPHLYAE